MRALRLVRILLEAKGFACRALRIPLTPSELGLTSALCKNLYEANFSLKSKHDALLARIPTQLGQSISPLPSPTRALSPLPPTTPHYYSISRPSSPSAMLSPSLGPSSPSPSVLSERSRRGHARRISVTPSDLTYLADQNAELMHKLEKLEEESAQADARGKRKLKKLEKEIGLLKEELEKTRERGHELEERVMKKVAAVDEEEEEQKRRKREERVKALRGKSTDEDKAEKAVTDFAPAPELPKLRTTLPATIPEESEDDASMQNIAVASSSGDISILTTSSSISAALSPISPISASASQSHPLDYAIIAQLISKIQELEETNAQITSEQRATSDRLQTAQREVDSIKRAYEYLGQDNDDIEVCVVADDDGDGSSFDMSRDGDEDAASAFGSPMRSFRVPTGHTIRFSSLRRTIDGDNNSFPLLDDPKDDFASGVMRQSTTRSMLVLGNDEDGARDGIEKKGGAQKSRKTVVGLFDNPGEGSSEPEAQSGEYPASLHVPSSFRPLSPIAIRSVGTAGEAGDVSGWSDSATDNDLEHSFDSSSSRSENSKHVSPIPHSLDLLASDSRSPSPSPSQLRSRSPSPAPSPSMLNVGGTALHTLGSELGSEFGDDWGERAGNHHLRATSLYDMSGDVSMGSTGSVPGGWILDGNEDDALLEDDHSRHPTIDIESEDDHVRASSGASTVIARSVSGASASGSATPSGTVAGTPTRTHFPFHEGLHPQVVVQPPTPSPNKYKIAAKGLKATKSRSGSIRIASSKSMPGDGSGVGVSSLEKEQLEKANSRNARLSQTVRARTNRWVERRYTEYTLPPSALSPVISSPALPSLPFPSSQDMPSGGPHRRRSMQHLRMSGGRRRRTASTAKEKMGESFEEAVHRVSRSISFSASGSQSGGDFAKFQEMELNFANSDVELEGDDVRGRQALLEQVTQPVTSAASKQVVKKPRFVGFVLEVWLWLQFAIVVLVFLWAMARKGPKSVLADAERSIRQVQRAR